jgi:hypothetical protein
VTSNPSEIAMCNRGGAAKMIHAIKLFSVQKRSVGSFYHQIYPLYQAVAAPRSLEDRLTRHCISMKNL